jgi:hypothetical protein
MPVPGEDLAYQQRTWRVERIGWVVLGLAVAAAMAGAFGAGGPLGEAEAADPDGVVTVRYQRFERYSAPAALRIIVSEKAQAGGDSLAIRLDRAFLDAVKLRAVFPQPDAWTAGGTGSTMTFRLAAADGPPTFLVLYEPARVGTVRLRVAVDRRAPVEFAQFVYP